MLSRNLKDEVDQYKFDNISGMIKKTHMAMRMRMTIQAPYRVATTQAEVMFLSTDHNMIFNFF